MKRLMQEVFYDGNSKYFLPVNNFLALLTIVSVLAIILESVQGLGEYSYVFGAIEFITVLFFTLEYIGRAIAFHEKPLNYIFSFFGIIDLLAIVPSYVGVMNLTYLKSVRMLRILRFLRILRIAKLSKVSPSKEKMLEEEDLLHSYKVRIYVIALISSIIIFGSLMYVAESSRVDFQNIPTAMIWSAKVILGGVPQTMPQTVFGEFVTIGARFMGLLLFGLLISVVGGGVQRLIFGTVTRKPKRKRKK